MHNVLRLETFLKTRDVVASQSTVATLTMRTSNASTIVPFFCQWQTVARTPTDPSFSSPLRQPAILTAFTSFSAKLSLAKKSWRRLRDSRRIRSRSLTIHAWLLIVESLFLWRKARKLTLMIWHLLQVKTKTITLILICTVESDSSSDSSSSGSDLEEIRRFKKRQKKLKKKQKKAKKKAKKAAKEGLVDRGDGVLVNLGIIFLKNCFW